jgi:hypothetical protein
MVNPEIETLLSRIEGAYVNTENWYRKETDLWAEFGKKTPFTRKFSSKHSVKMPAVVRTMCGSRTSGWSLPCVMS